MATALKDKINTLDAKRSEMVEARTGELIAEELSLRDLRHVVDHPDRASGRSRQAKKTE